MALSLYDPKKAAYVTWTPPTDGMPTDQLLTLNVLIELKIIAHYLQAIQAGTPGSDEVSNIRTDVVSVI